MLAYGFVLQAGTADATCKGLCTRRQLALQLQGGWLDGRDATADDDDGDDGDDDDDGDAVYRLVPGLRKLHALTLYAWVEEASEVCPAVFGR